MWKGVCVPVLVLLGFVVLVGCGGEAVVLKETLTDKEKQQVKELNEQRQDEWGGVGKKKK